METTIIPDFFHLFLSDNEAYVNSLENTHSFHASLPLFLPRYIFFSNMGVLAEDCYLK